MESGDESDFEVTDEKAELQEASEDDASSDEEGLDGSKTFRLGQQDEEFQDFSGLLLKDDAPNRRVFMFRAVAAGVSAASHQALQRGTRSI